MPRAGTALVPLAACSWWGSGTTGPVCQALHWEGPLGPHQSLVPREPLLLAGPWLFFRAQLSFCFVSGCCLVPYWQFQTIFHLVTIRILPVSIK